MLSALRDDASNANYDALLGKLASDPDTASGFTILEGSVSHADVLGNTLEGLVIHTCHANGGGGGGGSGIGSGGEAGNNVPFAAKDVVRMIENGETSVVKFKFPAYTVRTMCMRSALRTVRLDSAAAGKPAIVKAAIPLGEFGDFVDEWAARWCVTEAGQAKWRHFAWEAFLLRAEKPETFPLLSGNVPALHIRLADHVAEHGVRVGIHEKIEEYIGTTLVLRNKITVVLPFASDARQKEVSEW